MPKRRGQPKFGRPGAPATSVAPGEVVVRRRWVLVGGMGTAFAAFALYALTMARGLTWANTGGDGGDFLAAAFTWGIPHPTGYPTYIVLLRLFGEAVPIGSEAFRGSLFSAVTAAASVGVFFGAVWQIIGAIGGMRRTATRLSVAVFAAIAYATGNLLWSQATITEVYALGALFAAAVLWLGVRALGQLKAGERPRVSLTAAAFLLGLALGNSVTIGLFAAPLTLMLLLEVRRRFGWTAVLDWMPISGLFAGLAIYVYAPVASAQDPPLNWFMPHTWDGFWEMATASLYQDYLFGTRPGFVPSRILAALDLWLTQYSVPGAILAVAGLSVTWERYRPFALATLGSVLLLAVYAISYYSFDPYVYLVPAFMLIAAWMAVGLASLLDGAKAFASNSQQMPLWLRQNVVAGTLLVFVLLVPVWSVAFNYRHLDISDDREAQDFVEDAFATAGPGSIIFAEDIRAFSLWYQEMVADRGADVAIAAVHMLPYDWYWEHMQRRYPDRMPPGESSGTWLERMAAIIEHNRGRSVFFTDSGDYNEGWTLLQNGPLLEVSTTP